MDANNTVSRLAHVGFDFSSMLRNESVNDFCRQLARVAAGFGIGYALIQRTGVESDSDIISRFAGPLVPRSVAERSIDAIADTRLNANELLRGKFLAVQLAIQNEIVKGLGGIKYLLNSTYIGPADTDGFTYAVREKMAGFAYSCYYAVDAVRDGYFNQTVCLTPDCSMEQAILANASRLGMQPANATYLTVQNETLSNLLEYCNGTLHTMLHSVLLHIGTLST